MELLTYTLLSFGSLFSIVDPIAAVPAFLALVGMQPPEVQKRTAFRAAMTCFAVLGSFALAGSLIFKFFGITIPAFKIAGGILLFGVGLEMMRAEKSKTRETKEEQAEAETKEDVGLIPLGLPLLSGPGAIAAVMVLAGQAKDPWHRAGVFVAIALVSLSALLVLRSSTRMSRVLGKTGMNVISRIMGLILAAVAIQFVIDGVREAFPRLM
jgi:multiple antibiotic resistance protein